MTLLITVFAAIISTVVWYMGGYKSNIKIETLMFMYWGASIMWFVDAIFEYAEAGAAFFVPASEDMINDAFLGVSVVAFGLIIWLAVLLVKDPRGVVKTALLKK